MNENKLIINKSFMSKTSCFKVQLTKDKECYMHTGKKQGEKWDWKKAKFNSTELGELIDFLGNDKKTVSFFHSFNNKSKIQIYFNKGQYKDQEVISPIIDKLPGKALAKGEQVVLNLILQQIIVNMNME